MATASNTESTMVVIDVVANGTEPDGDTLSVTGVTTPTNGTAAINSGSTTTVTYDPDAGFNGQDSFDYNLFYGTDAGTVTVTVTVPASAASPWAGPSGRTGSVSRPNPGCPATWRLVRNDALLRGYSSNPTCRPRTYVDDNPWLLPNRWDLTIRKRLSLNHLYVCHAGQ